MVANSASFAAAEQFVRAVIGDLLVDAAKQAVWTPIFLPESIHDEWQVGLMVAAGVGAMIVARRTLNVEETVLVRHLQVRVGSCHVKWRSVRLTRKRE